MIMDKKAFAANKRGFDLHVSLLMEVHKLTKMQAIAQAYAEGPEKRAALMAPPSPAKASEQK